MKCSILLLVSVLGLACGQDTEDREGTTTTTPDQEQTSTPADGGNNASDEQRGPCYSEVSGSWTGAGTLELNEDCTYSLFGRTGTFSATPGKIHFDDNAENFLFLYAPSNTVDYAMSKHTDGTTDVMTITDQNDNVYNYLRSSSD